MRYASTKPPVQTLRTGVPGLVTYLCGPSPGLGARGVSRSGVGTARSLWLMRTVTAGVFSVLSDGRRMACWADDQLSEDD
jgi:hypothetical protein